MVPHGNASAVLLCASSSCHADLLSLPNLLTSLRPLLADSAASTMVLPSPLHRGDAITLQEYYLLLISPSQLHVSFRLTRRPPTTWLVTRTAHAESALQPGTGKQQQHQEQQGWQQQQRRHQQWQWQQRHQQWHQQ